MEIGSVDIAAMSVQMHAAQTQQQVDIAVLKNNMDSQEEIADMLISELMQVNLSSGGHIDISV